MSEPSAIAKFFLWKRFSSFTYLNITQFLVTLVDSIFRMLVAYALIEKLGTSSSSHILFISGVVFVTPFLIFSMPAGELADKFPKQKVIAWTLVLEIIAMIYAIYAMKECSVFNAYASLFCVGVQAALFLPAKYAILPEIVPREEISRANGFMTLATYVAIIFGTFLASFFTQVTNRNYEGIAIFCTIVAAIGFYASLQIEKTTAKNPTKKVNPLFLVQVYKSLKIAKQYPHLLVTIFASAYFLYTASFTQLNIIPFGIESLKITDVQSGYILLAAAFGVGVGSMFVAIASGKNVELGLSIWGAFATSVSYIILYLFSSNMIMAILMIFSLGAHGGLYIVPIDAYIQIASPEKDRGEIVAAASFLGFVGVLLAALSLGLFSDVLHLTAAQGYLFIGVASLIVSTIITFFLPEYFSRVFAVIIFKAFYHITPLKQPKTDFYESLILICRKYSLLHILSLIYLYPRIAFIRFVKKKPFFLMRPIHSLLHMLPIPLSSDEEFHKQLQIAIDKKMPLCIFLESDGTHEDDTYKQAIEKTFADLKVPALSLYVHKKSMTRPHQHGLLQFFKKSPIEVEAVFSEKTEGQINLEKARQLIEEVEKGSSKLSSP